MYEIRLQFLCGCIDRWPVHNEPPADEVELHCEYGCPDCQRKATPRTEALEMMAEAAVAMRRMRPLSRKINQLRGRDDRV